jgi:hypothetical protein
MNQWDFTHLHQLPSNDFRRLPSQRAAADQVSSRRANGSEVGPRAGGGMMPRKGCADAVFDVRASSAAQKARGRNSIRLSL